MHAAYPLAPDWRVAHWLNTASPLTLQGLRGRVVVIHAFQMLCPACVSQALPQAARMHALFSADTVCVLGLHTVFEHHAVTGLDALKAFVHEYRLQFPIGVDQPDPVRALPLTLQAYGLQGTPSLVLIDKAGRVRMTHFGAVDDLAIGAAIGQLSEEAIPPETAGAAVRQPMQADPARQGGCADGACVPDPSA